jgi:hypothetical protein
VRKYSCIFEVLMRTFECLSWKDEDVKLTQGIVVISTKLTEADDRMNSVDCCLHPDESIRIILKQLSCDQ